MNAKNTEMFFGESDEEVVISLENEDGESMDAEVIIALEIEDLNKEYVAVLPTTPNEEFKEGECLLMIYSEDESGNPHFEPIEDESEFDIVNAAFMEAVGQQDEDDDEYTSDDDFLDDIPQIFPGVSIDN